MYILRVLRKIDEYFHYLLQNFSQLTYCTLFFKVISNFLGPQLIWDPILNPACFSQIPPECCQPPPPKGHVSLSTLPSTNSLCLGNFASKNGYSRALTQSFLTLQMLNTIITHLELLQQNSSIGIVHNLNPKLVYKSHKTLTIWFYFILCC